MTESMHAKPAKKPKISSKTKLLCFDLESNGLHGEVFAVGAVVMDANGKILDQYTGRSKIVGSVNEWVKDNVLTAIEDMVITHGSAKDLRESFWRWYVKTEPEVDYVLVSNGYPVEYRFLIKCQEENLEERFWQHPFPILDLSSLLLQADVSTAEKASIKNEMIKNGSLAMHHPLHDAKMSALLAFESFKKTGKIK